MRRGLSIACLTLALASIGVWVDSSNHFTTARTPTVHARFVGVVISHNRVMLMESAGGPHGFRFSRRYEPDSIWQRTRTEIAGFGYGRSVDGSYIFFPIWSVVLLVAVLAVYFARRRPVKQSPGFPVNLPDQTTKPA